MKQGFLSDFFVGVGAKRVSAHEVDPAVSRGHEFQDVKAFRHFLGEPGERRKIPATYLWIDEDEQVDQVDATATWYDSRRGQTHRESEGRFYYPAAVESVVHRAADGDVLFVALRRDGSLLFILCPSDSSARGQLEWLFNIAIEGGDFSTTEITPTGRFEVGFTARYVLDLIGVVFEETDDALLQSLTKAFGQNFPTTGSFSSHARKLAPAVDTLTDPDHALITWMDFEERLFRIFERHILASRLREGFAGGATIDIDAFMSLSLSAHQRRKSRAGFALENHLEFLFARSGLSFDRGATTEGKKRPDFLFPSGVAYRDISFPANALTLLGAKSTCKDRWRQVLSEGARVDQKHLLTLEPSISSAQTDEMQAANLRLVLPRTIHETYSEAQRHWLLSVTDFIDLVRRRAADPA
ncbi:MAG: type II restriction endonuclease [Hyphomonadaceae bacterium]|nr:type II restriction endonuclease [Hyphomonadaceae bacterium]